MNKILLSVAVSGLFGFGSLYAEKQESTPAPVQQEKSADFIDSKQLYQEFTEGKWKEFLQSNGEAAAKSLKENESMPLPILSDLSKSDLQEIKELSDKVWGFTRSAANELHQVCAQKGAPQEACAIARDWNEAYLQQAYQGHQLLSEIMVWIHQQKDSAVGAKLGEVLREHLARIDAVLVGAGSPVQKRNEIIILGYWKLGQLAAIAEANNQAEMKQKILDGTASYGLYTAFDVDWEMFKLALQDADVTSEPVVKINGIFVDYMQKIDSLTNRSENVE